MFVSSKYDVIVGTETCVYAMPIAYSVSIQRLASVRFLVASSTRVAIESHKHDSIIAFNSAVKHRIG